ncbi:MAG: hypothetical protein II549_07860 [Bacteroidaceae bacterium]|nr:hypothetical protein [Bacteroidaceae bacterium]
MKKILPCLMVFAAITAHAQSDSIPPSLPPTYPYLTPISTVEELNADVMSLKFSKADANAKKLITAAKRKKQSTAEYDKVVARCRKGENGLRGVDRVIIVDSVVVDKKDFLKAYPIAADMGSLTLSEKGDIVQYQTQLNGMVLYPVHATDSTDLQIMRYYLENDRLTEGEAIEGLGIEGDINYPFLMPDGQTFYFAARCDEGYGNYDLYATRYDSDSKQFYQAENMGFPYNSYANDYMLVIDEAANLGWFASDRYQPHGKVCIYTFIPNESRQTIDYESTDLSELQNLASLQSISAIPLTDEQKQAKAQAKKRLSTVNSQLSTVNSHKDFEFVLNDQRICYTLDDFKTPEAKQLCSEWVQKTKNYTALNNQLQEMRETAPTNRQPILNLEARIMELQSEMHHIEKEIRKAELVK